MRWSLNTCLAWMAEEIGPDNFYRYLKAFGFDRNTGIDLGGETHWPLKLPGDSNWYESTWLQTPSDRVFPLRLSKWR